MRSTGRITDAQRGYICIHQIYSRQEDCHHSKTLFDENGSLFIKYGAYPAGLDVR
jgi:hypothetical protein